MNLDRRKAQFLGDHRVVDAQRVVHRAPLHHFGDERAGGNRRTTTEGLKLGIFDDAVVADAKLELHHIAACRGTDEAGAHVIGELVERADVAGVFVVVDDFAAVGHVCSLGP